MKQDRVSFTFERSAMITLAIIAGASLVGDHVRIVWMLALVAMCLGFVASYLAYPYFYDSDGNPKRSKKRVLD